MVGYEKADKHQSDGDIVEDNAVKQTLVDVAIQIDKRHAFEEGVDGEADDETCDGMDGAGVAVAGVGEMAVVMLGGLVLLLAAGAVVVAVLGSAGELFKQQLDKEAHHDGGGNLEVPVGCDKTIGVFAKEDVGYKIDETRGEEKGTSEDGDVGCEFGADVLA